MAEFNNELRGVLFKVPDERRVDKGPIYSGTCEIRGQKYQISAWINTSQKGAKYMSLRFQVDNTEGRNKAKRDSQRPLENDDGVEF